MVHAERTTTQTKEVRVHHHPTEEGGTLLTRREGERSTNQKERGRERSTAPKEEKVAPHKGGKQRHPKKREVNRSTL